MSLLSKAQPMLPGEVNGWSFVNDRVSSVPSAARCGGCSSAMLTSSVNVRGVPHCLMICSAARYQDSLGRLPLRGGLIFTRQRFQC